MLKVPNYVRSLTRSGIGRAKARVASAVQAEPSLSALAITLVTLVAVILLRPGLSNVTPALACSFLLLLLIRRLSSTRRLGDSITDRPKSAVARRRVLFFVALEFALFFWIGHMNRGSAHGAPSIGFAIMRYMVLIPPVVLLPISAWIQFWKQYRAECLAAVIGLLTFYPYRLFAFAWPWYSHALVQAAYMLAHPFVPALHVLFGTAPTLSGPSLDVNIIFGCGGLEAIRLFQVIFALALVLDWNVLNHRRLFFAYFAGLAAALVANATRIALLVIVGNRFSPGVVVRYHIDGSWGFFVLVFAMLVLLTYVWLRSPGLPANSSQAAL